MSDMPHTLLLAQGDPVRLRGDGRFRMRVLQSYRIAESHRTVSPFEVNVAGYFYALLDDTDTEVLSYQWHPRSRSPITFPHMHLGAGAKPGRVDLLNVHFPTGLVSFWRFVQLLIMEFGVEPIRPDWQEVLESARID